MYRIKDLKYLEVFNTEGKKLGEVEDVGIDYYKARVTGFFIPRSILRKDNFIKIEDVITIGDSIIANKTCLYKGIKFDEVKGLDIIDRYNKMIGVVEEMLIDESFFIRALITSRGFFKKFKDGKNLILLKETMLGEHSVLYFSENKIDFVSLAHSIWGGTV